MPNIKKDRRKIVGLVPGSLVFTGNKKVEKVLIHYLRYDSKELQEEILDSHESLTLTPSQVNQVDWYDIRGMHDTELIENFGSHFKIHPLVLEDVVDIHQRPKFEEFANGIFVTMRALSFDKITYEARREHVAIYFNDGFLVTFQETESDLFVAVRNRINSGKGRIRERGADYLAYALMDTLVDHYYVVLDDMEETIEALEEKMTSYPDTNCKGEIHQLKKELLKLRRSIGPLREAVSRFAKSENDLIKDNSFVFIRDLYEHTIHIMDSVETYRDILNGLQDLYISEVSFRMNKVMQLLTLISVIFIPLTFLAGIYGMNFDYIPELKYKYGYFILLGVMLVIFVILLIIFRRKRWL